MTRVSRLISERHLLAVLALLFFLPCGTAAAGEPTAEELERLKQIWRDRYARSAVGELSPAPAAKPSDAASGKATEPGDKETKRPPPSGSQGGAEKSAFERYVRGDSFAEVPTNLEQFGYDLFSQDPGRFAPVTAVAVGPDYVVGPGDELRVRIWGKVELEAAAEVDRAGNAALPKAGVFPVAGLSLGEVRNQVKARYDKVFTDYQMDVSLGALRSISVFVVGKVSRPGRYNVSSVATMLNALLEAGGATKTGTMRDIQLIRGGKPAATLDLYDLILNGKRSGDARLQPEDTVFVPGVGQRVAIAGSVRSPAIYELAPAEMKLGKLISLAGGLEPTAARDRVQIERVDRAGGVRLVEVDGSKLDDKNDCDLRDGDIVRVFSVLRKRGNVVYLAGNVARPGAYELKRDMRVADLISDLLMLVPEAAWEAGRAPRALEASGASAPASGELRAFPEPYWNYALIRHLSQPELRVQYVPFNLGKAILEKDPAENKALAPQDTVIVFSKWDFVDVPLVRVGGAVNKPGAYPLTPNMQLRDLVSIAGGLKSYAYRGEAELLRVHFEEGGQREERIPVALARALEGAKVEDVPLRDRDHLFVRSVPEHRDQATATIRGEVRFPGTYPIRRGERLSSLIERAGGYTDLAYLRGAGFLRESVRKLQQERLDELLLRLEAELSRATASAVAVGIDKESVQAAAEQAKWQERLLAQLRSAKAKGRVVIALGALKGLQGSAQDITLEDGDQLHVPMRPATIGVLGSVYEQSAFLWSEGMTFKHYLRKAGGATRFADEDGLYVLRLDGSVASLRQGGEALSWDERHHRWVRGGLSSLPLEPGDTIVVPEKLERVAWLRDTRDITQILFQVAVTTGVVVLLF